jgi:hypothetical protein
MAGKDWPRGRGEVAHLSNLNISTHNLDPDYEIVNENLVRRETRYQKVFSLIARTAGKPSFHARVDDGTPDNVKDIDLDIDVNGVSDAVVKDFRAGRNGYVGHHTNRSLRPEQRIFEVVITTPAGKAFEGEVSFNVAYSVGATFTATSSLIANAEVVPAKRVTGIRRCFAMLLAKLRNLFR